MSEMSHVFVRRISDLQPHPNADNLMVSEIDGMPFIVNKNDTKNGDLRCIVPFEVICPDESWVGEFTKGKRVKPMRLRGIFSMAVCLPLPENCNAVEGEDVTERLGFIKWIPPEERETSDGVELQSTGSGRECSSPSGLIVYKYDLESLRKYHSEFSEGEQVIITEKLEGENISVVYWNDSLHVKSRNRWIEKGDNKWWTAVAKYDWTWLKENPGLVAMGEKYGNVNKFRYDCSNGEENIRLFDVYDANKGVFVDHNDWTIKLLFYKNVTGFAPHLYKGPWLGLENHKALAEGKSTIGDNTREGFVVQPIKERVTGKFQRVKYKMHGEQYLIQKGKLK